MAPVGVPLMRYCTGCCGRLLPPDAFASKQRRCRGCQRVAERERYRKFSRRRGFLAARRKRERRLYQTDPAWAARKKASVMRSYYRAREKHAA